ncbi:bifunctional 2-C-methyl-D-erythritol 4-phosphate cytidylyltransferase/2-C-methyl-D-erythritol 2,4-cyclodiphosphate synthase [Hwanghaeella sp. LZ110]|uniref:bifunctional 2-C-methyl-D-erythritol 4-phosphate cytidylyltransferase/2-C-methyl-D-erythritol 2,4-cyclodiphosphate synthase n=1 Tax=Hwanghaeella sp. LZ110 TaxID=3402810 RepID=UPI003B6853DB
MPSETAPRADCTFHAVIVAAGQGLRVGGTIPKQYRPLAGVPVLRRTIDQFRTHPGLGKIIVVIGEGQEALCAQSLQGLSDILLQQGGKTRQNSVFRGLQALSNVVSEGELVLIHDAARPFISNALIDRVLMATQKAGAAIPALPVIDTLKQSQNGQTIQATVSRQGLYRAQTPQGFNLEAILDLHRAAQNGPEATDDAALVELAGGAVQLVEGDAANVKLTTERDFQEAEQKMASLMEARTGTGFDVHRFEPGDAVWLCGVRIPHSQQLKGHSDADVGLHAITDALLGAIAQGDIGDHFPPSDPQWRGAASDQFLRHAAMLVAQSGGRILHIDATLICEAPRVGPHRQAMRERIADILHLSLDRVSVKATTTEKLGFTGRGEGIACQAVATVSLMPKEDVS